MALEAEQIWGLSSLCFPENLAAGLHSHLHEPSEIQSWNKQPAPSRVLESDVFIHMWTELLAKERKTHRGPWNHSNDKQNVTENEFKKLKKYSMCCLVSWCEIQEIWRAGDNQTKDPDQLPEIRGEAQDQATSVSHRHEAGKWWWGHTGSLFANHMSSALTDCFVEGSVNLCQRAWSQQVMTPNTQTDEERWIIICGESCNMKSGGARKPEDRCTSQKLQK